MALKSAGSEKKEEEEWCPCGIYDKADDKSREIHCPECNTWWHIACSGWSNLSLTPTKVKALKWKCPVCVVHALQLHKAPAPAILSEVVIQKELKKNMPAIMKAAAQEALKEKHYTKSVADATKASQKEFSVLASKTILSSMDEALKNNQQQMIQSSTQRQDADNLERQKRQRNVLVSGLPESTSKNTQQRYKDDLHAVEDLYLGPTNMPSLVSCFRVGSKKVGRPRSLIVTMKTPEMAQTMHNYGRGVNVNY